MKLYVQVQIIILVNVLQSDRTSQNTTINDIVVIWLAAAETTRKVHCTVTAYNITCSRSVIIEVIHLLFYNCGDKDFPTVLVNLGGDNCTTTI